MALGDLLIHRCTIEEATRAADEYGALEVNPSWASYETGVRCRLVEKQQRAIREGGTEYALITIYQLIALPSLVLDEERHYRIVDVLDQGGAAVDAGPFLIESQLRRRALALHHRTFELQKVGP